MSYERPYLPDVQGRLENAFPQDERILELQHLIQNNPNYDLRGRSAMSHLVFLTAQLSYEAYMDRVRGINRMKKADSKQNLPRAQQQQQQQPQPQQQPQQPPPPPPPPQQQPGVDGAKGKPGFVFQLPQDAAGKAGGKVFSLGSLDKLPPQINLASADPSAAAIPIPSDDDSSSSDINATGQPVMPEKSMRKRSGKS